MTRHRRTRRKAGWRWLTALLMAFSLLTGAILQRNAKAQTTPRRTPPLSKLLARYTTDLTLAAQHGQFNSIDERTSETDRAIQVLTDSHKNNPVVITDSQAIRDVVAIGLARRLAQGDVPAALQGKRLLKLNLDQLFHDSKTAADLVNNVSAILSDAASYDTRTILLIDPIQSLVGPKSAFDGAASALVRDAINAGQMQCFGASTETAFVQNVASEESLAPLFAPVQVQEITADNGMSDDQEETKENKISEKFVGDNISPDVRELLASRNAPARVKAILQVEDPK